MTDPAVFDALAGDLVRQWPVAALSGKGSVYPSGLLAEAFGKLRLAPDFAYAKPQPDTRHALFAHRRLADGDRYFESNRLDRPVQVWATFRTKGYRPEIWDAVTGNVSEPDFRNGAGATDVRLSLPAYGSAFIVFRKSTIAAASADMLPEQMVLTLRGPWTVAFQPHRWRAGVHCDARSLQPWSDSASTGVRYFSGTAVYSTAFELPQNSFGRRREARARPRRCSRARRCFAQR